MGMWKKAGYAILAIALIVSATAMNGCKDDKKTSGSEIVWTDSLTPEDMDPPSVNSPAVRLPEKPSVAPTSDKSQPTVFGEIVASDACYTLQQTAGGMKVIYDSEEKLPEFAYLYIPVMNYNGDPYFKIKANCTGVQRLSIMAVYYELYDLSRPAVTVYNDALIEGENTVICRLAESTVLDAHYNAVLGEKLTDKTVCGFMLMVDSNPKQQIDDYRGELMLNEVKVVDATDPDLILLDAPPFVSAWNALEGGYFSCGITQTKSETTGSTDAVIEYAFDSGFPYVEATLTNYKPEYTTLKMDIKGDNVKNVSIAIKYTLKSSAGNLDYNYLQYSMKVNAEWESLELDFSTLEELTGNFETTVPGSYVKNLKPVALYFFIDTDATDLSVPAGGNGTLFVRNISFEKEAQEGAPRVTATWTLISDGIEKKGVQAGGIGTLTYNKRQGWNAVTINVGSYDSAYSVFVVKVKFYGASNIGIALGYGSNNLVIQNSDGDTRTDVITKHTQEEGTDDLGSYVFHTYEIDFSAAVTANGELLKNQAVNKIMLYIDAVALVGGEWKEMAAGTALSSPRTMQFVGMEFRTSSPQIEK